MRDIHHRLQRQRVERIDAVDALLANTPRDSDDSALLRLEMLYLRRDRLRRLSTWPVDVSAMQRALLYFVIPPLAWIGAALVEMGLEQAISN